ncbi:hypothetical protein [Sphingopyxis sp. KK2]|uniref:hypothetical protein n=1 Tax=Sphingopyxis sp. KK2 TaxID=1855727 RepID=UPI0015C313A1|nr:hypothetical protein [Sphingopyxis sp. KK2]
MGRKVALGKRGKSVAVSGDGGGCDANPLMPGLRIREDGWTEARTRVFLATLAQTGCVADAARIAGVSTTSVNRSRGLFPPFDKACVEALANALRGLEAVAYQRAVVGRETVIYRGGKEYERRITPSDNLLRLLIRRGDLSGALGRALSPAEAEAFVLPEAVRHRFIDRAEFESGIVFERGVKQQRHIATQEETDAVLLHKISMIKKMRGARGPEHPCCAACGQKMPLTEAEMEAMEAEWEEKRDPRRLPPPAAA